ncbi:MAG: hypothetical protein PHS99_02195 [Candidatus Marinimicrobia bacterium]|nr:hypothetical protein [Candidatus Neomarinimicrobiota bacterium]
MKKPLKKTQVLIFLVFLLSSCHNIFAPETGDIGKTGLLYQPVMDRPNVVLENFRYAYIYRDSLIYSTLIDSNFVFVYYEPDDEGGGGHYESWPRDVELRTTGGLFRAFRPIDLIWNSTLDSSFSYMREDTLLKTEKTWFDSANYAEIVKSFQLNLGENLVIIGSAIFNFVRNPWDKQWRIVKWRDESSF